MRDLEYPSFGMFQQAQEANMNDLSTNKWFDEPRAIDETIIAASEA